jgi:hypothetical protein
MLTNFTWEIIGGSGGLGVAASLDGARAPVQAIVRCYSGGYHSSMATVPFDAYVLDILMADLVGHDRAPAAFLVYLQLAGRATRAPRRTVTLSYQDLADRTGLSRSAVQAAVRHLKRRRLVHATQAHRTATPEYEVLRPWVRGP